MWYPIGFKIWLANSYVSQYATDIDSRVLGPTFQEIFIWINEGLYIYLQSLSFYIYKITVLSCSSNIVISDQMIWLICKWAAAYLQIQSALNFVHSQDLTFEELIYKHVNDVSW